MQNKQKLNELTREGGGNLMNNHAQLARMNNGMYNRGGEDMSRN